MEKKSSLLKWVIIANLILWPVLIYLLVSRPTEPLGPAKTAYYFAQKAIEESLKSPSTAEYQPYEKGMVLTDGNNTYKITLWVDAENSFGAKIRADYIVLARHNIDADQWELISLTEK